MQNFTTYRISRMSACRADLLESGIDLAGLAGAELAEFVREQLEYFQAMLGDDTPAAEVEALVHHERMMSERETLAGRGMAVAPPGDAATDQERAARRREAMSHMTLDELVAAATELRRRSAEVIEQMEAVQERFEAMHLHL